MAAKRFKREDLGLREAMAYEQLRERSNEPTIQQQDEHLDDHGLTYDILSSPIRPIIFSRYRYLILLPLYEENLAVFRDRYIKQRQKIIDDITLMFLLREMVNLYVTRIVPVMSISLHCHLARSHGLILMGRKSNYSLFSSINLLFSFVYR